MIAAIHGACVGGGVDMISACDIRYCSQDAWFQIKVTFLRVITLNELARVMFTLLLAHLSTKSSR